MRTKPVPERFEDIGPLVKILDGPDWLLEWVSDASALTAHLPGKHDQSSHGRGGGPELLHDDEATINATYNYTDEKTGIYTEVSSIRPGESHMSTYVSIKIRDRDGNVIGNAERTIRPPDQRSVEHGGMAFEEAFQGQGFATRYNAHVESAYIDHGIEKIHLNANLDVGGYAWARAGYDFNGSAARATVAAHAREVGRKFNPDVQAQIRQVADNPRSSPVDFAMIGHQPGMSTWPGKQVMLGVSWDGVKNIGPSGGYTQPELTAALVAHLPGKHDQSSHGKGGLHESDESIHDAFNFDDTPTGLTAEVRKIIRTERTVFVSISIRDKSGAEVGESLRTIDLKKSNTISHDRLELQSGLQGQGFASRFNAHAEQAYRAHGINRIELKANVDVGGYAWARAGYDFRTASERKRIVSRATTAGRRFTPEVQAQIRDVASNPNASPIDFAMIGHVSGVSTWPGKQIMLGATWDGVKRL